VAILPGLQQSATTHVHLYAEHAHPEHRHGPGTHRHDRHVHPVDDHTDLTVSSPDWAWHSCEPAHHQLFISWVGQIRPAVDVTLGMPAGRGAFAMALVPLPGFALRPELRSHDPPPHQPSRSRAPPFIASPA
jgi:hypothetical protein